MKYLVFVLSLAGFSAFAELTIPSVTVTGSNAAMIFAGLDAKRESDLEAFGESAVKKSTPRPIGVGGVRQILLSAGGLSCSEQHNVRVTGRVTHVCTILSIEPEGHQ